MELIVLANYHFQLQWAQDEAYIVRIACLAAICSIDLSLESRSDKKFIDIFIETFISLSAMDFSDWAKQVQITIKIEENCCKHLMIVWFFKLISGD